MFKFKKDLTIWVNETDSEFVFRKGYSYCGEDYNKLDVGMVVRVWNIDKSVVVELDDREVEEYLEV